MFRCIQRIRSQSSATRSCHNKAWDPIKSLALKHPTLVILETKCKTRHHFKQILSQVIRNSLVHQTFPMSRLLYFSAIAHPENLDLALILFNHFSAESNLYIYNTLISALSPWKNQSFGLYSSMLRSSVCPDKNTLLHLLRASKNQLLDGKGIHCHAIVLGLCSYDYLQNSLIRMYLANGYIGYAQKVFDQMPTPDIISFNIMIVGHAKLGCGSESIEYFHKMVDAGIKPDEFTMLGILICCGNIRHLHMGKSIHGWMERRFLLASNLILRNALLDMYVRCNELYFAQTVFRSMQTKDAFSWNTMISGYARSGKSDLAHTFLDEMPIRDTVSWNTVISEYARKGDLVTVRGLFDRMQSENLEPDEVTLVNLVSVATEIRAIDHGKSIHGFAFRKQIKHSSFLGSALIDMYSKCGNIQSAIKVFHGVTKSERDVTLWTTMITGFAFNGYGTKALELFSEMHNHVTPNNVTLISILSACSHNGLVDEGLNIFNNMLEKYGIQPEREHFGCVVDLLSRYGKVKAAFQVIERMPMKPGRSIWGSLLSACKDPDDTEIAELASRELLKLDPEEEGGYLQLCNMYAASGKWRFSDEIRDAMENHGLKKTAGKSIQYDSSLEPPNGRLLPSDWIEIGFDSSPFLYKSAPLAKYQFTLEG
ncbi:hypothetical protein V2J09_007924 [Rumex salicifolius]